MGRSRLLVPLIAATVVFAGGAALAQPSACPSPVTDDLELDDDCRGPMVIREDDITVDLNGFAVRDSLSDGIVLDNVEEVTVKNGFVEDNADAGISIRGGGDNTFKHLVVRNNGDDDGTDVGIRVGSLDELEPSFDNEFVHLMLIGNFSHGAKVQGPSAGNEFEYVVAMDNGQDGINFDIRSDDNELHSSFLLGNNSDGLEIGSEGEGNEAWDNFVFDNGSFHAHAGILLSREVTDSEIEGNFVRENFSHGIRLQTNPVGPFRNDIEDNTAAYNGGDGIRVEEGAKDNEIEENRGRGNMGVDARDDNLGCDDNDWDDNDFGTTNAACIE